MSRIRLTIDQLTLRGFNAADGRAVIEGLRAELARVLSDPSTRAEWARAHRTPVLRLGPMPLETGSVAGRKFGQGMARAIGKGLKP
jgi:hypothetical protein